MVKFGWDKLKRFLAQANTWTGQQTFSNIAVTGGTVSGANITVGSGKTLDVSAGTLTLANDQISGAKVAAATTTTEGVVELATVAETVAGTSTTLTPTCNGVAAAVAVLAREPDQGVAMTAATSDSNGIAVADDDDIDYGTGNFFGVIPVLLADYTPAAEVVLEQKTDGTNGREFTLQTNGKLRVTINTTDYDSTVATGCTDNTKHVFGYSVTRETAAAAGSIIFVVDGVQLGDAVAITAGAPTTINNAVSQYVLGTSATRTDGTVNGYISGNRALTAAEHLALYRNGIAEADKWGSQTAVWADDCADDGTADWSTTNSSVTFDTDHYNISTNVVNGSFRRLNIPISAGKKYEISARFKDGTAAGALVLLRFYDGADQFSSIITTTASLTKYSATFTSVSTTATGYVGVYIKTNLATNNIQMTDFVFKPIGATLALEDGGIQPAPGQWLDSSSNNLHALQPATGGSLTRSKRDFTIKWTNTWAGTHEVQYIGGLNQAILPPNCYIDSIIGVITGGTIEDIIIGDGSDDNRWVEITTGLAAGTVSFTIVNKISDGTNYKMTVDPDANFTGSIAWTINGKIL